MTRQIDNKNAAALREVPCIEAPVVRLHTPTTEGETEAQAGPIGVPLLEGTEQIFLATRETPAFVFDFNEDTLGAGANA